MATKKDSNKHKKLQHNINLIYITIENTGHFIYSNENFLTYRIEYWICELSIVAVVYFSMVLVHVFFIRKKSILMKSEYYRTDFIDRFTSLYLLRIHLWCSFISLQFMVTIRRNWIDGLGRVFRHTEIFCNIDDKSANSKLSSITVSIIEDSIAFECMKLFEFEIGQCSHFKVNELKFQAISKSHRQR